MKNIKLLNKIAKVGTDKLDKALFTVGEEIDAPHGIMVRSANMLDMEFGEELCAIARAGAGVNNIPIDRCADAGIVVFNTPGANANAVKELVICSLMLASRDVIGGVQWASALTEDVAKQVEKGKSKFAGVEVKGKTLGVIGLGAIGGAVANTAIHLGMDVVGCDPYLSVESAQNLDTAVNRVAQYDDVYTVSDYITLHVPSTPTTKGMINKDTLSKMKDGVRILNFSRADLVEAKDLLEALESGKVASYVTDFPTEEILGAKGVVAIPHLGASTEESEDNCAVMAALELSDYIINGNIKNSVNYPALSLNRSSSTRICILHKSEATSLASFTAALANQGVTVVDMASKVRGAYAYTIFDVETACDKVTDDIKCIDGVLRVRVI